MALKDSKKLFFLLRIETAARPGASLWSKTLTDLPCILPGEAIGMSLYSLPLRPSQCLGRVGALEHAVW